MASSRSQLRWLTLMLGMFLLIGNTAIAGILVIAPHPDDDIITAAGVVHHALQRGDSVQVVFMTNGDAGGTDIGYVRQNEAVDSQVEFLNMIEDDLIFLGYPDSGMDEIYRNHTLATDIYTSLNGQSTTYGSRGIGRTDYHSYRFGSPANYNRSNMVMDLSDVLQTWAPDHIFVTGIHDTHSDHFTTYKVLKLALDDATSVNPAYSPMIHTTIVWSGEESWPNTLDPFSYFDPIPNLGGTGLLWEDRESLDVLPVMQSHHFPENKKYQATGAHKTQGGLDGYLGRFIHKDEFFWVESHTGSNHPPRVHAGFDQIAAESVIVQLNGAASLDTDGDPLTFLWEQVGGTTVVFDDPTSPTPSFTTPGSLPADEILSFALTVSDWEFQSFPDVTLVTITAANGPVYGDNIGALATVTASTERVDSEGFKAVDGVIDGYPGDHTAEWITAHETDGAWLRLDWLSPVTLGKIILFDRPNTEDHVIEGNIEFDDGTNVPVHAVDNYGRSSIFTFPAKTVSSMTFRILSTGWESQNIGLAELEIYPVLTGSGNQAPIANAGPDQAVGEAVPVQLDGAGSYDPDSSPLTYSWVQTSGIPVVLSDPTDINPTFQTPSGLSADNTLIFQLVVHDGILESSPDLVKVEVQAAVSEVPLGANIASEAVAVASTDNLNTGQTADKVIDTFIDGYPNDHTREWATLREGVDAWIDLAWTGPRTIQRIVIHDRPNPYDHLIAGRLTFSDGAELEFDSVPNDGTGLIIDFAPRETTSLRLTVTRVGSQTGNVGLSELEVFESGQVGINRAPTANAGPDQSVDEGVVVQFDGSGSADPDADTLTFQWLQTAGLPVTLSDSTSPTPTFTAPAGLSSDETIEFQLTVHDGSLYGFPDRVSITISAAGGASGSLGANIAPDATTSASSEKVASGQTANKAIDGIIDGYPGDYSREWATQAQGATAWIELSWVLTRSVQQVVLFDRPNEYDHITGGTLTFSDGTSLPVPELDNAGTGTVLDFDPKDVNWVRLTVDSVGSGTVNVGLSEFEVYETAGSTPNTPPIADADPDQGVDEGAFVSLDATASFDPDLDPITYLWTQVAGMAVALSDNTSPTPTFTAPTGLAADELLTFQVVVNDGAADSPLDTVDVIVTAFVPPPPTGTNIAPEAVVTASSESNRHRQTADKAVDGFIEGYPGDSSREWSTKAERVGAWIELTWSTPRTINSIHLYDRPNMSDHIRSCTLTFSDGSSIAVGTLDNAGGGDVIVFAPKNVTSVRMTVDSTSPDTWAIGLSEIEVISN